MFPISNPTAFYVFEFNIPANTPESSPVKLVKDVTAPLLQAVRVVIPNGHLGLARLRIETRGRSIMPTDGSDPMWIRGDGGDIAIFPNLRLEGPRWELIFYGWNEDAVFDHAFLIYLSLTN